MATERQRLKESERQLNKKLKLEKTLFNKMRRFFRAQNKKAQSFFDRFGLVFNAQNMTPELEILLTKHYNKTAKQFTPLIVKTFNDEFKKNGIEPIDEKDPALLLVLLLFIRSNVRFSVEKITDTSNKEILKAVNEKGTEKRGIYKQLQKKNLSRSNTVAMTETQKASEGSKQAIAEELDNYGQVAIGAALTMRTFKFWMTRMDKRVRPRHKSANGQEVPVNDPFIVGGEFLLYPSDSSLGASSWNTINCRCNSLVEVRIF